MIGAIAAAGTLLTGCGGPSSLVATPSTASSGPPVTAPGAAAYLAQLNREQQVLAAAERSIPAHPRTSAALSGSIALLAGAVRRLADGLSGVRPPPPVSAAHRRLVGIVRTLAAKLDVASGEALRPDGELRAAELLVSATGTASTAFSGTVTEIDRTLTG